MSDADLSLFTLQQWKYWIHLQSMSLLLCEGSVTLQLTRNLTYARGFFSPSSVTGFLSDVSPSAADEVGKIYLLADERVQGAVFDLPEEIAKNLLSMELPQQTP